MHQSNDVHQSPGLDFLIEEYKNLSQAFFQLHAAQLRSFQFFLAFNAVPLVAVWGNVSRWSASIGVRSLPSYCYWLLLLFGFINLVFALHIASLRIEQYRYARAVNQARRAFTDAAPTIAQYLYLPTTRTVPVYHRLGSTTLLTFLIVVIAAIYTTLGIAGLWHLEPGVAPGVSG